MDNMFKPSNSLQDKLEKVINAIKKNILIGKDDAVEEGLKKLSEALPAVSSNPVEYTGPQSPFFVKRAVTLICENRKQPEEVKISKEQEANILFSTALSMLSKDIKIVEEANANRIQHA